MSDITFDSFWEYLMDQASRNDAWWLAGWLEENLEEYKSAEPCPECASRITRDISVWSKTGNHVLEYRYVCPCGHVRKIVDRRAALRESLKEGRVKVCDVETLTRELDEIT